MLRILVVDDSLTIRAVLSELIARENDMTLVGAAASAVEALQLAASTFPDVITIDVAMPGTSGIELLQQLPNATGLKSIMLSGDLGSMHEGVILGADAFFDKKEILRNPASFLDLMRRVGKETPLDHVG